VINPLALFPADEDAPPPAPAAAKSPRARKK
jgi:hypothetical protein